MFPFSHFFFTVITLKEPIFLLWIIFLKLKKKLRQMLRYLDANVIYFYKEYNSRYRVNAINVT